jgi:hypothetical protein
MVNLGVRHLARPSFATYFRRHDNSSYHVAAQFQEHQFLARVSASSLLANVVLRASWPDSSAGGGGRPTRRTRPLPSSAPAGPPRRWSCPNWPAAFGRFSMLLPRCAPCSTSEQNHSTPVRAQRPVGVFVLERCKHPWHPMAASRPDPMRNKSRWPAALR